MTTAQEIQAWFIAAEQAGATHMLVVCDQFDWSDYPVSVGRTEDVSERIAHYRAASMQRVMEVYDISLGWEAQSAGRVWNA